MANVMVSPAKVAKALGVSRKQVARLAAKAGIGCIYTVTPRPYYSSQIRNNRGSCRYLLTDVLLLIDLLYAGDKSILATVKHNLSKVATPIDGLTVLRDDSHLLDDVDLDASNE